MKLSIPLSLPLITVLGALLQTSAADAQQLPWQREIPLRETARSVVHTSALEPNPQPDWNDYSSNNAIARKVTSESRVKPFGDPDKIDVLVVTGGHGFDREPFFALFDGSDDIRYVEHRLKDDSEVFEDVSNWEYDVVMLYHMTQNISPKRQDNFVRLLKNHGIGVVVVHHAEAAFQSWLEYHQIIGTAYIYLDVEIDGKPWPHGKCEGNQDIAVTVRDCQHPITRGMQDFHIHDETYKGRWWAEGNHILLTTDHPQNDAPVAWTRQYGRSRVFNIQFGHDKKAYDCPQYRDLIVRGIRWTAGALK
jgi:uncharacterized protein